MHHGIGHMVRGSAQHLPPPPPQTRSQHLPPSHLHNTSLPPRTRSQHLPPPEQHLPPPGQHLPPWTTTFLPPPPGLCTGRWYASYWNAFWFVSGRYRTSQRGFRQPQTRQSRFYDFWSESSWIHLISWIQLILKISYVQCYELCMESCDTYSQKMFHFVWVNIIHGYLIALFMHRLKLSMDTNSHFSHKVTLPMDNITLFMHRSKLSIDSDFHFLCKVTLSTDNANTMYSILI